jgi:hypothetical protein
MTPLVSRIHSAPTSTLLADFLVVRTAPCLLIPKTWSITTLFRVQSGQPQVVQPSNNPTNGAGQAQGVRIGDVNSTTLANPGTGVTCAVKTGTVATWFNPCAFANPPVAQGPNDIPAYGGYGRSVVYGPGYNRVDLSLFKTFNLYRETALDIRADLFNALNTPAYGQPNATIGMTPFPFSILFPSP